MKKHKNQKLRKVYYEFYSSKNSKPHPLIKIAGQYLEAFGFKIGDKIKVELKKDRIQIVRITDV